MDGKTEPTPVDQKLFLVFIVTFASMTAFEFAAQFLYPFPPDWRSNLITSLFVSGLAVVIAYFPLNSYYVKNVQALSEMERRRSVEKELRESESRLGSIIRVAPIGIGVESNRIIRTVNDQLCRISGYTAEELTGRSTRILYPAQDDYDFVGLESRARIVQKGSGEVETRWQRKDGMIIDVLISSTPVDPSDLSFGVTFTVLDITERKRAETVLRESENKFATVFRSSPVSLTLVSIPEGTFVDVNDAFLKSTGYSRDEVIGRTSEALGIFADGSERGKMASALRDRPSVYGLEVKCRVKSGEIRTCLFSSGLILMGGKPYVLSNVEDITERRAMESAYQALVRSMVGTTGLNSLQKITENVSSWLGADCVMVGEIQPDNRTVKVLSMLLDGKEIPDFSYSLTGTPSGSVAEKGFCLYPDDVTRLFPESRDLARLNIRGYIGTPLRNSAGQVFGILSALSRSPIQSFPSLQEIMDIIAVKAAAEIERTQIERALRESEEKYRVLADNATDIIWILDLATRKFTYFSPSVKKIQGFTPEEAVELPLEKMFTPESYTRAMAELKETLELDKKHQVEHNRIRVFEFQEFCKDGSVISTETRMRFIRNADGIPIRLQGITRDITERKRVEEALKESEDFNRGLVENMPDMVTVYGHDRKIRYANLAVTRRLGYSAEELSGTDIMDYLVPEQRAGIAGVISERLATGNTKSVEVEILGKEGQRLTVITQGTPVRYHTEPAVLLVLTDISERKAMETAYQAMIRSMVGTTGLNSLQKITENVSSWLGADCVMVGEIQPDNPTVKVLSMLLDGKEIPDFSYTLTGTPSGNVAEKGFCLYPDDVTRLFPESRDLARLNIRGYIGTPLRNSAGQVFGILSALSRSPIQSFPSLQEIMDIIAVKAAAEIERTQIERALRESEEKFRMVVENSLDGILIVALTGVVLFRNRALANIFDIGDESYRLGTKNVMGFIAPESRSQVLHDFSLVAQGIDSYPVDYQAITATGRRIWIESIGKRITFQNSPAILISMKDISSRKRMEEAILRANKNLNLLYGITRHDINNQLVALNGFVELLRMNVPDPAVKGYFSRIMEASSQITAMIRFTKEYEEIGVRAAVWQDLRALVESAGTGAMPGQVALKNDLPAGTEVFADPLIVKVFFNLIDNALRHGGRITAIRFALEERNGDGIIVCEDDGDGVVREEKERIFERGFGKNTGFGLAISREILDITGITIKETGEPGTGARFEMTVPKGAYRITGEEKNPSL